MSASSSLSLRPPPPCPSTARTLSGEPGQRGGAALQGPVGEQHRARPRREDSASLAFSRPQRNPVAGPGAQHPSHAALRAGPARSEGEAHATWQQGTWSSPGSEPWAGQRSPALPGWPWAPHHQLWRQKRAALRGASSLSCLCLWWGEDPTSRSGLAVHGALSRARYPASLFPFPISKPTHRRWLLPRAHSPLTNPQTDPCPRCAAAHGHSSPGPRATALVGMSRPSSRQSSAPGQPSAAESQNSGR